MPQRHPGDGVVAEGDTSIGRAVGGPAHSLRAHTY